MTLPIDNLPLNQSPSKLPSDAAHASVWESRIQDAIDQNIIDAMNNGVVDAHDQQLLVAHLQSCASCRELQRRLSAVDIKLHSTFTTSAKLSADFDVRLFAQIAATTQDSLSAKRQREQRDYQTWLTQLQNDWHVGWQRRLANLFGIVATIVTLLFIFGLPFHMSSLSGWSNTLNNFLRLNERLSWLSHDAGIFRLPAFAMLTATLVAAFTLWFIKRSDRQLR